MKQPRWLVDGAAHVWRPYCQHKTAPDPLPVVRTHGCRLVLADGKELVDGISSWWTACHGYNHEHIRERVSAQLMTLPHVAFGGLAHESAYTLAARLAKMLGSPLSRVFFVESGSVAVEVALKMCIQSWLNRGRPTKKRVVAFENGYHGDTFKTMSIGDPAGMHRAFVDVVGAELVVPLPHANDNGAFEAFLAQHRDEVACVVIEPLVQAAGGMRFHDVTVLRRIRQACTANDVLLVLDEIATGFHRTGERFAFAEAGIVPDVITLGKALTGGTLPLACAVATEALFNTFLDDSNRASDFALQHGPTYMGNALACAAAHASLDLFEQRDYRALATNLEWKLSAALAELSKLPNVVDVRAKGAIGVVEMKPGTAPSSADFAVRGAFIRPLRSAKSDVVYLMPPLVIDNEDLRVLIDALTDSIGERGSR